MTKILDDRIDRGTRAFILIAGTYVLLGALVSFLGWPLDIPLLTDWDGDGISIQPNTCVLIAIAGAALILLTLDRRRLAAGLAGAVALGGCLTLLQYVVGADFGFNHQLLFGRTWGQSSTVTPGRMGPPASSSFTLLGIALFLAATQKGTRVRSFIPALAFTVLAFMSFSLIGYLVGAEKFYSIPWLSAIALQTTSMFIALAAGAAATAPEQQPIRLLRTAGTAGTMARRVLPLVVFLPLLLGWLRVVGEERGYYDAGSGRALLILAQMLLTAGLVWWALVTASRKESAEADVRDRLAGVLGSIDDSLMTFDRDWRFTYVNDEAVRRLGRSREALLGRNLWELLPDAVGNEAHEQLHRAMAERISVDYEVFYPPWQCWFRDKAYPNADGGLTIFSQDITARKQAGAELDRQRRLYEGVLSTTPDLAYIFGLDHRFLYANEGLLKMWGRTWEEAIGKNCIELGYEPWHAEKHDREIEQVVATKQPIRGEVPFNGTFGRRIYDYIFTPVIGENGAVVAVAGTTRDVTDIRASEQALREAGERLRNEAEAKSRLHELSAELVSKGDLKPLLEKILKSAADFTGTDKGNIQLYDPQKDTLQMFVYQGLGQRLVEHFAEDGWDGTCVEAVRQSGRVLVEDVEKLDHLRGAVRLELLLEDGIRAFQCTPLVSRGGRLLGVLNNYYRVPGRPSDEALRYVDLLARQAADLIERSSIEADRAAMLDSERVARTEAENLARLKDEFLATVSHELRTPLNSILGWAQLLKRKADEKTIAEAVDAMLNGGRMQAQIIEDLLDMNRIMSGKLRLEIQNVELARVLEEALTTVRPAAEAKNIRIQSLLTPGAGPIKGDPVRLQQVCWNLLGNAVKFTPKGGRIQVVLERKNSHVEVTVTDTGVGIRADFLPHVFERFRQSDSSSTRTHSGLGLGLAIAKQIVELHGGSISVVSEGEGKGATFRVQLPVSIVKDESQTSPVPENVLGTEGKLTGVRILVVDDDPGACEVMKRLLAACDAEVEVAGSGGAALDRVARSSFDILICDIGMPEIDGYDVMRRLRGAGATLPAIAVTAFARTDDRIRALQAGFNMHLSKPVDARELVAAVETLLRTVAHT